MKQYSVSVRVIRGDDEFEEEPVLVALDTFVRVGPATVIVPNKNRARSPTLANNVAFLYSDNRLALLRSR